MRKELTEMTLEELWQLFPIILTEHKSYWADWYREEISLLKSLLPKDVEYHHIGSTAIDGIMAKPIIDILIVVNSSDNLHNVANILQKQGYIIMSTIDKRISLNKGYSTKGFEERVFHLHLRLAGDTDEIYFRDYLKMHQDIAKEYEKLKLSLFEKYRNNRDAYTEKKTEFVTFYTKLAKQRFLPNNNGR